MAPHRPAAVPAAAAGRPLTAAQVLALQRTAGNRAVGQMLAQQRTLARSPLKIAPKAKLNETMVRDVDRAITETISHAPVAYAAWNNTFNWQSKWRLRLTTKKDPKLEVVVRLYSTASKEQKKKWEKAITSKWDNKFSFCVKADPPKTKGFWDSVKSFFGFEDKYSEAYPIRILIGWVDSAADAHYTITANAPGADEGGRAGIGGTTSMTGWGTADTTDITHEFGHILGCPEEYFTTNGVDYAALYGGAGFRIEGAGVMNNPAGPALARNFNTIKEEAAALRGVAVDKVEVV